MYYAHCWGQACRYIVVACCHAKIHGKMCSNAPAAAAAASAHQLANAKCLQLIWGEKREGEWRVRTYVRAYVRRKGRRKKNVGLFHVWVSARDRAGNTIAAAFGYFLTVFPQCSFSLFSFSLYIGTNELLFPFSFHLDLNPIIIFFSFLTGSRLCVYMYT